jgi:hypothetical protein
MNKAVVQICTLCWLFLLKQLVYCVRVMSASGDRGWSGNGAGSTPTLVAASRHNTQAIYQPLFMQLLPKNSNITSPYNMPRRPKGGVDV